MKIVNIDGGNLRIFRTIDEFQLNFQERWDL